MTAADDIMKKEKEGSKTFERDLTRASLDELGKRLLLIFCEVSNF